MFLTRSPALLISVALVMPFVLLEGWNNGLAFERALDYVVLFGFLWVLSLGVVVTGTRFLEALRSRTPIGSRVAIGVKLALLVFFAAAWLGIVNDQLPCFLADVNCD